MGMPSSYASNMVSVKNWIRIPFVGYFLHLHNILATKTPSFIASPSATAEASAFPSVAEPTPATAAAAGRSALQSTLAAAPHLLPLAVEVPLPAASSVPAVRPPTGLGRAAAPLLVAAIQLALSSLSFSNKFN